MSNKSNYERLKDIQEEYPFLTFQNNGYEYLKLRYPKEWEEHREIIEEISEILKGEIESFIRFDNFKKREDGSVVVRCQYMWDERFSGVGYFPLSSFKPR